MGFELDRTMGVVKKKERKKTSIRKGVPLCVYKDAFFVGFVCVNVVSLANK